MPAVLLTAKHKHECHYFIRLINCDENLIGNASRSSSKHSQRKVLLVDKRTGFDFSYFCLLLICFGDLATQQRPGVKIERRACVLVFWRTMRQFFAIKIIKVYATNL